MDLEYDNFGTDAVVNKINEYIKKTNEETNSTFIRIAKTRIEKQLKDSALMTAIEREFGNKNQKDLYKSLRISKPGLSKSLFEPRCRGIRKEIEADKWQPKLPMKKLSVKIFEQNARWRG